MENTNSTFARADALLKNIDKSIFVKALVISLIAHVVLTGATSVSLFRDWGTYGVKAPATINKIKQDAARAEEDARRKKAAEEKAALEAAKAEEARKFAETNKSTTVSAKLQSSSSQSNNRTIEQSNNTKTPPEIEPLPPKKDFQLGDDLSLD